MAEKFVQHMEKRATMVRKDFFNQMQLQRILHF
jgi:hypothetical protein